MAKRTKAVLRGESARPNLFGSKSLAFLETQTIYCGDNLDKLRQLPDACIDLIYIDPPFNPQRNFNTFAEQDASWEESCPPAAVDDLE